MNDSLLLVDKLSVDLELGKKTVTVVDELSFCLEKGQTLGIVGESGSGKSLTALSFVGLLPRPPALPARGRVIFEGMNLLELSEKKLQAVRGNKIGFIFQDPMSALNPVYTIGFQIKEQLMTHRTLSEEEAHEIAIQTLKDVHMPDPEHKMDCYPHELSGGLKQRAMIAMALSCDPLLLIADEPTTALDVTVQAQILDLLRGLQEKRGLSIILITHDMGVIAEMADFVMVMYAGQVVEYARCVDLFDAAAHPYTRGLFSSRGGGNKKLTPMPGVVPHPKDFPKHCHFAARCSSVQERCKSGPIDLFTVKNNHCARCVFYDSASL